MRKFLMTVFWITNVGNVIQTLIIVSAIWIIFSSAYAFSDLSVGVFITQYIPWLIWLKDLAIELLGGFGLWIFELPVLVLAPVKLITGTIIGLWAYSVAKTMPVNPARA